MKLCIVYKFINTYRELLDALWNKIINYIQFQAIYEESKIKGLQIIPIEIEKIRSAGNPIQLQ
jgi:hypothetical protein